jgi:uncharacterized membrane protein (DUF2068 family)
MRLASGVRAIAFLEAAKGLLVLAAGFALLAVFHADAQRIAEELVGHLHLNPAKGTPRVFIQLIGNLFDRRLWMLATLAGAYSTMRFIEAYGLWRSRRWAEWFAAASGAVYIPFEIYELLEGVSRIKLGALVVNVVVVAYMAYVLVRSKRNPPFS